MPIVNMVGGDILTYSGAELTVVAGCARDSFTQLLDAEHILQEKRLGHGRSG